MAVGGAPMQFQGATLSLEIWLLWATSRFFLNGLLGDAGLSLAAEAGHHELMGLFVPQVYSIACVDSPIFCIRFGLPTSTPFYPNHRVLIIPSDLLPIRIISDSSWHKKKSQSLHEQQHQHQQQHRHQRRRRRPPQQLQNSRSARGRPVSRCIQRLAAKVRQGLRTVSTGRICVCAIARECLCRHVDCWARRVSSAAAVAAVCRGCPSSVDRQ